MNMRILLLGCPYHFYRTTQNYDNGGISSIKLLQRLHLDEFLCVSYAIMKVRILLLSHLFTSLCKDNEILSHCYSLQVCDKIVYGMSENYCVAVLLTLFSMDISAYTLAHTGSSGIQYMYLAI